MMNKTESCISEETCCICNRDLSECNSNTFMDLIPKTYCDKCFNKMLKQKKFRRTVKETKQ